MSVATTILEQIGGNRFRVMTGAKNFLDSGNALSFRLPSNFAKDGINGVRVELTPLDTYTMKFYRIRGAKLTPVAEVEDVYNDQLEAIFREYTGLATRL